MSLSELSPRDFHTREDWSQLSNFWELTDSSSADIHHLCHHPSVLTPLKRKTWILLVPDSSIFLCVATVSFLEAGQWLLFFPVPLPAITRCLDPSFDLPQMTHEQRWPGCSPHFYISCISITTGQHNLCFLNRAGCARTPYDFFTIFFFISVATSLPQWVFLEVAL